MKRPEFVTLIAVVATDMPIIFNALCDVPMTVRAITESCRVLDEAIRPRRAIEAGHDVMVDAPGWLTDVLLQVS